MSFKIVPVNQAYWNMSDKRRQKEYEKYCKWFEEKKQTQEGMQELVDGKRFNGWKKVKQIKGQWRSVDFHPDNWGMFCMNTADPELLIAAATVNQIRNKEKITEAQNHVGGNPNNPLLDPEYLARAEATKALREQMRKYAGEAGDALVLAEKKKAEEAKKDWTQHALDKIKEMRGDQAEQPHTRSHPIAVRKHENRPIKQWLSDSAAYLILGAASTGLVGFIIWIALK